MGGVHTCLGSQTPRSSPAPRHSAVRAIWPSTHPTVSALRITSFRRSITPPACAATDASSTASRPVTHGSRWNAVGYSFVPQDFHPLPPHQLAWRSGCHEMSWGGESFTVISASFQAKGGTGVSLFCARFACGRGRVSAPARFAHLIARARRWTHLSRLLSPGAFSAPSRSLSAETPKGGPGSRLSLLSSYTIPPNVKPHREQKGNIGQFFLNVLLSR